MIELQREMRIGYITLLCPAINKRRNKGWFYECDCGKIGFRETKWITCMMGKNSSSCGCKQKEIKGKNSLVYQGYEDISSTYFTSIKLSAKQRHLKFEITIVDVWDQYIKQNKKCSLSGQEIKFYSSHTTDKTIQTASIDRINSDIGYLKDNIQILHKDINMLKNKYSNRFIIYLAKCITKYRCK